MEDMRSAVILAGGAGRRIGLEKAFLQFCGQTLIERAACNLTNVVDEIVIVARDESQAEAIKSLIPPAILTWDRHPGIGPLAGMHAGLFAVTAKYAFVVGCDLPFLNERVIEELFLLAKGHDGAVPIVGDLADRLHAVYRAKTTFEACKRSLQKGARRIVAPLEELDIKYVDKSYLRQFDPELLTFFNINTIEDLREANDKWQSLNRDLATKRSKVGPQQLVDEVHQHCEE